MGVGSREKTPTPPSLCWPPTPGPGQPPMARLEGVRRNARESPWAVWRAEMGSQALRFCWACLSSGGEESRGHCQVEFAG
uniref:Uncharacterized protein n=1 Tax=Oryza punctata TaxID=4537 RepID=A0A0E0KNT5_ORYPU